MDATVFRQHAELEDDHWWFQARQNILLPIVRRIMSERPGQIFDIGCGTGGFAAALSPEFPCTGIDSSEIAIEIAREKFPDTQFLLGNAVELLKAQMEPARLILLLDVIEHIEDPDTFLKGLLNTVPSGTSVLVTVPACEFLWSEHDVTAQHFRRYTKKTLKETWDRLPVRPLYTSYFNTILFTPILAARIIGKLRSKAAGDDQSDFYMPHPTLNWILTQLFSTERFVIGNASKQWRQFPIGVSLVSELVRL